MSFNNILDIKYPVIQAPMAGGILSPQIIAHIANSGFLANIASGYLSVNVLQDIITTTKALLTNFQNMIAVNVFIDSPTQRPQSEYIKNAQIVALEQRLGLNNDNHNIHVNLPQESEYVDVIVENKIPIASCTFGFFSASSVAKLKSHGVNIIGNATNIAEVLYCIESGADAVVIQGTEAGGHQASFLSGDNLSGEVGEKNTTSLIELLQLIQPVRQQYPQIAIIAAGGISTKNALECFNNGADYIQLGTAFMMTQESSLLNIAKEYIVNHKTQTTLTKSITGKYARGIRNQLVDILEQFTESKTSEDEYPFLLGHFATADLRAQAKNTQNPEYMSLWAGSNTDNLKIKAIDDIIAEIQQLLKTR